VRSSPGGQVIGTLPFYWSGIHNTGNSQNGPGGVWFEIDFSEGAGWVASWLLGEAPCGPIVDWDVVPETTTMSDWTIDIDPGEWDPLGQHDPCGAGGYCFFNGTDQDRLRLEMSPAVAVCLLDLNIECVPVSISDFIDYLNGIYPSNTYFSPPFYPYPDAFGFKPNTGLPYNLTMGDDNVHPGDNQWVVRIEQQYTP